MKPSPPSDSGDRRPGKHPCPRCDSNNTKFCYYNNYNLSQPRHFCKACRRYWTLGGTLRNIPVGGGTRKSISSNKRRRGAEEVKVKMMVMGRKSSSGGGTSRTPEIDTTVVIKPVASEPSDSGVKLQDAVGLSPFTGGFDRGFFNWPNEELNTGVEISGAGADYGEYFSWPELATETHM